MAKTRTGSSTVLRASRKISKMYHTFGLTDLAVVGNSAIYAATVALALAYDAWSAADDFPGQIDRTAPIEDIDIGGV